MYTIKEKYCPRLQVIFEKKKKVSKILTDVQQNSIQYY